MGEKGRGWRLTPLSKQLIRRSQLGRQLNRFIDEPNCSFLGDFSDQPFTAFWVWEQFFIEYGEKMQRFIEFGCDQGSTSVYFLLQCIKNGAKFIGYDRRDRSVYRNTKIKRLLKLSNHMRIGNGYKKEDEIREAIQQKGMSVIFTDCIDKPWEFKIFSPMLKRGDVLAIHDWGRAIKDEWVQDELKALEPFTLLYEPERVGINTLTRFFLKE